MEKLAKASEGGGCMPTPFHYSIKYTVVVYGLAERADTLYPYMNSEISVKYVRPKMWIRSVRVIRGV